jgi:polyisoprenoid-binding protein YceI
VGPAVADPWGAIRRGAQARGTVDRKEYGLVWNGILETGGVLVGDEVRIEIEVELVHAAANAKQAA